MNCCIPGAQIWRGEMFLHIFYVCADTIIWPCGEVLVPFKHPTFDSIHHFQIANWDIVIRMYRERTSSGQTSVITPNQLYRRRFRFCFIGNNFLSILEKRSSFLEKGFKAWLNFTPPNSTWFWFFGICSTEYSTKYSMKYENQ